MKPFIHDDTAQVFRDIFIPYVGNLVLVLADGCLFSVDNIAHQGPQLSGILVVAGGPVYLLTSVLSPQPRLLSQLLGQLAKYFQMVHFHNADLVEYSSDIR